MPMELHAFQARGSGFESRWLQQLWGHSSMAERAFHQSLSSHLQSAESRMGIENFIKDALHKPSDYVAYHVGRELAELYADKAIIQGETEYFDLEAFVRAEKCTVVNDAMDG